MSFRQTFSALSLPTRWLLGILGICVILLIAAQLLLSIFLDDTLGKYLKEEVRKSTSDAYQLEYNDIDLGLLGGSVELEHIRLNPTSSLHSRLNDSLQSFPVIGKAEIKALKIDGVSLWAYLFRNTLAIGSVDIDKPVILIDHMQSMQKKKSQSFSSVDSSLYALIAGQLTAFELGAFEIRNGRFSLGEKGKNEDFTSVEELNLSLQNIRVDSASAKSGRLFVTDDIDLDISGYMMNLPGGFYTINLSYLELNSSGRQLQIDSLQLDPRLPRYNFSAKKGVQIDRIDLLTNDITLREIDFPQIINTGRFHAKALNIDSTSLNIFHDMNKPFPPGRSPELPQLAFRQLPYPVKIDTIKVDHTDIKYTEHKKGAPQPGSVTFANLYASIAGLSNFREDLESNQIVTMKTQTDVMGKGLFNILFTFYLHDPQGTHTVEGSLGTMTFSDFNPVLENLAFVHMEGTIHSMNFFMKLNKEKARGSVKLNYEDLSVELLQSETLEQGTGQQVKSFIANTFVVKEDNNQSPLREGEIKFERNKQKSVFNFWWKALSTGLKSSIGL